MNLDMIGNESSERFGGEVEWKAASSLSADQARGRGICVHFLEWIWHAAMILHSRAETELLFVIYLPHRRLPEASLPALSIHYLPVSPRNRPSSSIFAAEREATELSSVVDSSTNRRLGAERVEGEREGGIRMTRGVQDQWLPLSWTVEWSIRLIPCLIQHQLTFLLTKDSGCSLIVISCASGSWSWSWGGSCLRLWIGWLCVCHDDWTWIRGLKLKEWSWIEL